MVKINKQSTALDAFTWLRRMENHCQIYGTYSTSISFTLSATMRLLLPMYVVIASRSSAWNGQTLVEHAFLVVRSGSLAFSKACLLCNIILWELSVSLYAQSCL
jgi:hypothetical protein